MSSSFVYLVISTSDCQYTIHFGNTGFKKMLNKPSERKPGHRNIFALREWQKLGHFQAQTVKQLTTFSLAETSVRSALWCCFIPFPKTAVTENITIQNFHFLLTLDRRVSRLIRLSSLWTSLVEYTITTPSSISIGWADCTAYVIWEIQGHLPYKLNHS